MKSSSSRTVSEQEKCPQCGKTGLLIPPTEVDHKSRKLIVKFKCLDGHTFTREFDLI